MCLSRNCAYSTIAIPTGMMMIINSWIQGTHFGGQTIEIQECLLNYIKDKLRLLHFQAGANRLVRPLMLSMNHPESLCAGSHMLNVPKHGIGRPNNTSWPSPPETRKFEKFEKFKKTNMVPAYSSYTSPRMVAMISIITGNLKPRVRRISSI